MSGSISDKYLASLMKLYAAADKYVTSGQNHTALAIVKGLRNGIVYGVKIRAPHAFVMAMLFKTGDFSQKMEFVFKATKEHATNLGSFVFIYKSLMAMQKMIAGREESSHAFVAGLIGGYFIWGNYTNVNYQVVLYLFSRIMIGMAKLAAERAEITAPSETYPVFAAVVWGIVMWLFRHESHVLHPSLAASMQYLYNDSEKWDSFKYWIWHNVKPKPKVQ